MYSEYHFTVCECTVSMWVKMGTGIIDLFEVIKPFCRDIEDYNHDNCVATLRSITVKLIESCPIILVHST